MNMNTCLVQYSIHNGLDANSANVKILVNFWLQIPTKQISVKWQVCDEDSVYDILILIPSQIERKKTVHI